MFSIFFIASITYVRILGRWKHLGFVASTHLSMKINLELIRICFSLVYLIFYESSGYIRQLCAEPSVSQESYEFNHGVDVVSRKQACAAVLSKQARTRHILDDEVNIVSPQKWICRNLHSGPVYTPHSLSTPADVTISLSEKREG